MARPSGSDPRTGRLGAAAMIAVLLTVLGALFTTPVQDSPVPPLPVRAALVSAAVQADSGLYADDADTAVCGAPVRTHRDVTGERPALPVQATLTPSHRVYGPPPSVHTPLSDVRPSVHTQSTDCHPLRAPPAPPGT